MTDCSSGKCFATSGESSTRFVPARKRSTYLPRTPPFNLDRSYSRRSSSRRTRFSAFFFILFSLARRRLSSRSACATINTRPAFDIPTVMNRRSAIEWSGSGYVSASGSPNTVAASRNEIRCFRRFRRALPGSHSKFTIPVYSALTHGSNHVRVAASLFQRCLPFAPLSHASGGSLFSGSVLSTHRPLFTSDGFADRLKKTQSSERYWQDFKSFVLAIPIHFRRQGVLDGRRPGLCTPPTLPPFGGESSIDGTRGTSLWLHKSSAEFRS